MKYPSLACNYGCFVSLTNKDFFALLKKRSRGEYFKVPRTEMTNFQRNTYQRIQKSRHQFNFTLYLPWTNLCKLHFILRTSAHVTTMEK